MSKKNNISILPKSEYNIHPKSMSNLGILEGDFWRIS